jgi:hypothetical protein
MKGRMAIALEKTVQFILTWERFFDKGLNNINFIGFLFHALHYPTPILPLPR